MKRAGVIGLGNMGSGLAINLIKNGFTTRGFDIDPQRMADFVAAGGIACADPRSVASESDGVFVMVMNRDQAESTILGANGLIHGLGRDSAIILTATIQPAAARALKAGLDGTGIAFIDAPVSGGFPGAQSGTLNIMAAADDAILARFRPMLEAVSATIHHVGTAPGDGQTVKACLQSLIGSIFSASFEAAALAAKAGIDGQVLADVVNSSSAGCGITRASLENIIDRRFENSGSHIATMYKDLTIAMDMARELGVPLFTASTAMQLFQAGITRYPDGDNWVVTRIMEDIVGAQLTRNRKLDL